MLAIAAVALAASAAALAVRPGAAASSGAGDPRIAVLQTEVQSMKAEVKDLRGQLVSVRSAQMDAKEEIHLNFEGDTCLAAQVADLVQGTWSVIDQIGAALQQRTYFGNQNSVQDYGDCADLAKPNVPRPGIVVPPSVAPLVPLVQWLHE